MKQKLVVIGNGMAGARAVEELLKRHGGEQYDIVMFGDEPRGNYNRILLSNVLNGSQDARDIVLHPLEWYRAHGIRLHAGVRAHHIDRAQKKVCGSRDGAVIAEPFDKLLIATGSRALIPPMAGLRVAPSRVPHPASLKPGVFVMRTLDDCARIAGYAAKCRRATVIGGGLLGLEAARGLMQHGAQVSVIHRSQTLMNQQLDETGGLMLRRVIESLGIEVLLGRDTKEVLGDESVTGLEFKSGETLECDMVVVACGIKPNVELARESGLHVRRGIVVDDALKCEDEADVYAVGECAEHRGKTYGLVAPLWEQARVWADVMSGANPQARYEGSSTSTKLKVMGVEVASMGQIEAGEGDEEIQYIEPRKNRYKKLVVRNGKLCGAILLGDLDEAPALMRLLERGDTLPDERATLLWDMGNTKLSLLDAPDATTVCSCNGVSKGVLCGAMQDGANSIEGLMSATRAGTGCGSCKGSLRELLARS